MKILTLMTCLLALAALSACSASGTAAAPKNGAGTPSVSVSDDALQEAAPADVPKNVADTDEHDVPDAPADGTILDIGEKLFVGQMNDIYANTSDYLGKTIRYEGFFSSYEDSRTGTVYNCIVRNGPGCCGYDSVVGFEFDWDGALPKDDDWCRITGAVGVYQEDGFDYIQIKAQSIEILPVRGNDTVTG